MKKKFKLGITAIILGTTLVISSGCGSEDKDLKEAVSILQTENDKLKSDIEALQKVSFYTDKKQYAFNEEIIVYYNHEKIYSINTLNIQLATASVIHITFNLVAYNQFITYANICNSFYFEWDSGIEVNIYQMTGDAGTIGYKNKSSYSAIRFNMFYNQEESVKNSSNYNLLITIPGTLIPLARMTLPLNLK